jgi:hypothetical protein
VLHAVVSLAAPLLVSNRTFPQGIRRSLEMSVPIAGMIGFCGISIAMSQGNFSSNSLMFIAISRVTLVDLLAFIQAMTRVRGGSSSTSIANPSYGTVL